MQGHAQPRFAGERFQVYLDWVAAATGDSPGFGGSDDLENLRLYCRAPNQLAAELWGFDP